jgi:hypothetical protein
MTNAETLAREIANEINARWHNPPDYDVLVSIIAAKIKPVVEDAERQQGGSDRCPLGDRPERYRCNICGGLVEFDGTKPKEQP